MAGIKIGEKAAAFGLLLAGQPLFTVAAILHRSQDTVRGYIPDDWLYKEPAAPKASPHKRRESQERQDAIVERFRSGRHTLQEVGDHFGVTGEYVRQILTKRGISDRVGPGLPREVYVDRLQRYRAALTPGRTTVQACAAAGLAYHEVQAAAEAIGEKPPRPIRTERARYYKIAAYYQTNELLTAADVARHFDVNQTTVGKALRSVGVTVRKKGWINNTKTRLALAEQSAVASTTAADRRTEA